MAYFLPANQVKDILSTKARRLSDQYPDEFPEYAGLMVQLEDHEELLGWYQDTLVSGGNVICWLHCNQQWRNLRGRMAEGLRLVDYFAMTIEDLKEYFPNADEIVKLRAQGHFNSNRT